MRQMALLGSKGLITGVKARQFRIATNFPNILLNAIN